MPDLESERTIEELRAILVRDEAVPPGLAPRLEAGVLRVARRRERADWEARVVVAALVFSIARLFGGGVFGVGLIVVAVIALAYAWLVAMPPADSGAHEPGRPQ